MQTSRIRKKGNLSVSLVAAATIGGLLPLSPASAQESDAETKALDSTATQWSFQLAYQTMPDYHDDILDSGQPRPAGADRLPPVTYCCAVAVREIHNPAESDAASLRKFTRPVGYRQYRNIRPDHPQEVGLGHRPNGYWPAGHVTR